MYNFRFQVASICFYLIFSLFYIRYRKLPLIVNKIFGVFHIAVGVNLLFDFISVYCISHMYTITDFVLILSHRLFLISLTTAIFLFYLYIYVYTHRKKGTSPALYIHSIPYIISLLIAIFGKIQFFNNGQYMYSYGLTTRLIYICIAYYLVVILIYTIMNLRMISKDMRIGILFSLFVIPAVGIVQLIFPQFLLSGLGVSLMFAFLYLSLENPRDYVEKETDVFNKHAFNYMIDEHMSRHKNFSLVILSLDDITGLNFRYGQKTSDGIIREISWYISKILAVNVYHPKENALACIMYCSKEEARKRFESVEDNINRTWIINNVNTKLSFRFGILACMRYASSLDEVYDVIEFFTVNKHKAKDGSAFEFIDEDYLSALRRYSTIELLVSKAVSNNGFEVFYQPIYSTQKKRIVTAEALIRLKDKDTIGYVSPEEFIPIAEKKGLIIDLGMIVMEKVCKFASETDIINKGIEYIEVNLSGLQCMEENLWLKLKEIMDRYKLPPSFFNFEITETVITDKNDAITNNMNQLINIGSTFSMDDFGSGNSNLSKIADLPFTLVKMDKSIVWAYFDKGNYKGKVILPHSVNMMNQLKMKIVAEGVETEEHKKALAKMGVEYLQGYYFSKPIPGEKFLEIINQYNKIEEKQTV